MTTLILTPTELEAKSLRAITLEASEIAFGVCGFGPVGAAVGTSLLLEKHSPDRVILAGIAGSLNEQLEMASAYQFDFVAMSGIGVSDGDRMVPPHELGFAEFVDISEPHQGTFTLCSCRKLTSAKGILTVCESVDSRERAVRRANSFPDVTAEDMEGYGVAMACAVKRIPLIIVRGISNIAGDRDKVSWRIAEALAATAEAVALAANDSNWIDGARQ